jgi:uncharacterized 2Fe-2S/4Fe-4S cluster protein (DUF4445 family)
MPEVTVIYGEQVNKVTVPPGSLVGEAIALTGLPLEQPCAGRGTCGKCKILVESGVAAPDEIEEAHLTPGELTLGNRLACRAHLAGDARIVLAPIVVYSNKMFRASHRYKRSEVPLGVAVDLGSTTVAAFLTALDNGEVCAGGASLNQQAIYGADVISRLAAADADPENAERLHRLALSSINQAIDSLNLSERIRKRIERVTIVGNVAMHHLLARLPVHTLAVMPFQPYQSEAIYDASHLMGGLFSKTVSITMPPMIGGFVGSDALACLAFFGFDHADGPTAAIDLGTNGEVMVTDGKRILTASTAAGPAFEGVFISCGTRAVDGAIVKASIVHNELLFDTIANEPPVGLTGSGLLSLIYELRKAGVIAPNGRINIDPPILKDHLDTDRHGSRRLLLTPNGRLGLSQWDVRELQKAKGAVRAAIDILMARLGLQPQDMERVILTGSFGAQVDLDAVIGIGMIPPVRPEVIETVANGAGLGAASFLSDEGFARSQVIAKKAEQVDLDQDADFIPHYVGAMQLTSEQYQPIGRHVFS